eukprot:contig_17905_g4390
MRASLDRLALRRLAPQPVGLTAGRCCQVWADKARRRALVTCRERGDEQGWGGGSSSAPDGDEEVIAVTRGAKEEAQQLGNKIKEPQPGRDAHETSDDKSQSGPLDGPISELTSALLARLHETSPPSIELHASECLGARLAARFLDLTTEQLYEQNGKSLSGLTVYRVLGAITSGVARHAADAPRAELVIGLHIDEYQIYKDAANLTSHDFVKEMLSEVTNFVKDVKLHEQLGAKVSFIPVVTGTPYRGLDILWTEWLEPVELAVPSLDHEEALNMAVDIFARHPAFADKLVEVREELALSSEAEQVLMASGYRPRLVEVLVGNARDQAADDLEFLDIHEALRVVNWQSAADALRTSIPKPRRPTGATRVARAALLQVPVRFALEPDSPLSSVEKDVEYAESRGEIELVDVKDLQLIPALKSPDDYRVVRLPFLQLLMWGGKGILPHAVYEVGRFRWADAQQELYVAHLLAARLAHWTDEIKSQAQVVSVPLGDLFPGALGSVAARGIRCVPGGRCEVYHEPNKRLFLVNKQSRPEKQLNVFARRYKTDQYTDHLMTDGVIVTGKCSFLFDCRLSVLLAGTGDAKVHLFLQAKQSHVGKTMSTGFFKDFMTEGRAVTKKWAAGGDRVIFVVISNRPLTRGVKKCIRSGRFFQLYPDLLLVSKNEISRLLPPDLLLRVA